MTVRRLLAIALASLASTACSVRIAHFTAIGDPGDRVASTASHAAARGETCHWWVLLAPLGLPRIEDALDDALVRAGTDVLWDAELLSVHPFYGPLGRHCYAITGTTTPSERDQTPRR